MVTGPDKYSILLYEFHRAFVEESLLPGYDYELLMNVEFLASTLVNGKHISRRDAFDMLSSSGTSVSDSVPILRKLEA